MKKRAVRRKIFISIILHALLILTVYVFQRMVFPHVRLFDLIPLLLPVVGTGIAVFEGRDIGGVAGLFAGIMCDISFNEPVGVFTILLTFTGLIVGTLADTIMTRGFLSFYCCSLAVLLLSVAAQIFPLLFFEGVLPRALFTEAARQTIYSLMFTFPIFPFVRALGRRSGRVLPPGRIR